MKKKSSRRKFSFDVKVLHYIIDINESLFYYTTFNSYFMFLDLVDATVKLLASMILLLDTIILQIFRDLYTVFIAILSIPCPVAGCFNNFKQSREARSSDTSEEI